MIEIAERIDEIHDRVMAGLKDFQQATVERVHELYQNGQRRVLVSDEVGLGKTMIAKGVIAKLARQKRGEDCRPLKVVYICSNSAIAGQNLAKLMIGDEGDARKEDVGTSRLSMQHLNIFNQESDEKLQKQVVQLIPLTPDTSFRMTYGTGTVDERALMYAFLRKIPELKPWLKALNIAMQDWAYKAWEWYRNHYEDEVAKCDKRSHGEYLQYMLEQLTVELKAERQDNITYLEELIALCRRIKHSSYFRVNDNAILGKLRIIFAQISLDRLEPDLVILDEFQRFKFMIDERDKDTDVGVLVKKFFSAESARMLLLSATPYKMYSTLEEIDEGEDATHFEEFFSVMEFLQETETAHEQFKSLWHSYSVELRELSRGNTTVIAAKQTAEDALYQHICRTERVSAKECADMIDADAVKEHLRITAADIRAYMQAEKVLEDIHLAGHVPVDYVKSCPYLLSFMQDYKLKRDVKKYFQANPRELSVLNRDGLWLKRQTFDRYEEINPGNARLAQVQERVFQQNAEKLLWVPPSRPYYPLSGVFSGTEHFTKTLIFSSWEMVPRMLSCMLSYEAERRTIGELAKANPEREARYFHKDNKRFPVARLNFSVNKNTPKAMTLFCLMYPSRVLASCYDPIKCMKDGMDLRQIEESVKEQIKAKLRRVGQGNESDREDYKWYYLVPMILDPQGYVDAWLDCDKQLSAYDDDSEKDQKQKGFQKHLQELRSLYKEYRSGYGIALGRMPEDLLDVLTTMAIASPAICALRTYQRYAGNQIPHYLPSQVAKVFINRMNTPESTAVIELCYGKKEDAHWQNLLRYCRDGNLQAVFDEYAHLLTNGMDRDDQKLERLHGDMLQSMNVRTTPYKVDTFDGFKAEMTGSKEKETNIRSHFAVSFVKGVGEDDARRKRAVRNAFNSPFRPFVLASTSIGQEGLDFHHYCRRIVHWNLPSNPIDLEQREGRINRFQCLAIRQNIADRYGDILFKSDIWKEMFKAAEKEKADDGSDLIPYWGVTERENMVRIERVVPMYPLSRDEISYERLIKILSLYRLTLGQARQEELVDYLLQRELEAEEIRNLSINLSPFYKK